ncbi:MAG: hypothetical protein SGI74_10585 [Oligoflexia bacterium]|nr:hypothetical protein [Oligoflexia bacterium]
MNRSRSFDPDISKALLDPETAQSFLLGLMEGEEGLNLEKALKHTISKMGVKEFAKFAKVDADNVVHFLKGRRKPKPETLDTYLKPFRLKSKLVAEKAS